jgi:hypothetical protein
MLPPSRAMSRELEGRFSNWREGLKWRPAEVVLLVRYPTENTEAERFDAIGG